MIFCLYFQDEATERLNRKNAVSRILKTANLRTNFDILARIIGWLMSKGDILRDIFENDCLVVLRRKTL